ncbi:conjugal transfer protein [Streptomyces malaysiensis]|uniref:conjugal transfer protein n=1 Tax=Streptomyces malaysiensis TaxID=92644 RepID=UPI0032207993|nr:conjugal transfer protein [Streptomyces malaysiensis]
MNRKPLTKAQKVVLTAAFVPMLATGVAGGAGTFSNISHAYGKGTAAGAVAAGEGATAVLALVLLGLTLLGQSSPRVVRIGLWALPAAASAMAAMAAPDPGRTVIYALTPMGMSVSAEGMAFLARRIVVHTDGRDADAEARAADVIRELAYHRAVAANHPDKKRREKSDRKSWKLARRVGAGDVSLGGRLLDVQRERVTEGAGAALAGMFAITPAPALDPGPDSGTETDRDESTDTIRNRSRADLPESTPAIITLDRVRMPDPVTVDFTKSTLPLKTFPAITPPPAPPRPPRSTRPPRRPTGPVPPAARPGRSKRTTAQLLDAARLVTADWPDEQISAEAIRRELRTSPANARMLRDTLLTERARPDDADPSEAAA